MLLKGKAATGSPATSQAASDWICGAWVSAVPAICLLCVVMLFPKSSGTWSPGAGTAASLSDVAVCPHISLPADRRFPGVWVGGTLKRDLWAGGLEGEGCQLGSEGLAVGVELRS